MAAALNDTRMFRLGINGTVITLRAVSHHAATYWIEVGTEKLQSWGDTTTHSHSVGGTCGRAFSSSKQASRSRSSETGRHWVRACIVCTGLPSPAAGGWLTFQCGFPVLAGRIRRRYLPAD